MLKLYVSQLIGRSLNLLWKICLCELLMKVETESFMAKTSYQGQGVLIWVLLFAYGISVLFLCYTSCLFSRAYN